MKKSNLFFISLLLIICFACSGDDQAQIRLLVKETFDSAKRGDIGFMMDRVHEENSALKILLEVRGKDQKSFDMALAELGNKTRELLTNKELRIDSIDMAGDRAVVNYTIISGKQERQGNCLLRKSNSQWKFRTLPGLEDK